MEQVVRGGKWSWMGEHEQAFCRDFAEFLGSKHVLCLSNGTVTIQCALQAVGVEPGHEVIVPGLTWVATAQAAMDIGADVVLVDIDPETLSIDPAAIEAAITDRTKAIIPVHLYGCMADMDAVMDIAARHDLKVVEDVAHQHGSRWNGKAAGTIGDAGSYSFQQSKVLTSGEGGAIACQDDDVYETAFCLKQVGWTPGPEMRPGNRYGHNYRITEMQCVLLRGGLSRLADHIHIREENAARIRAELEQMGGPLQAARRDPRVTCQSYYAMTLKFDPEQADGVTRDQYLEAVGAEGCPLGKTYDPVYANPLLNLYDRTSPIPYRDPQRVQNYAELSLPGTERAVRHTAVTLSHTNLLGSPEYMEQLLAAIAKANDNLAQVKRHFERTTTE